MSSLGGKVDDASETNCRRRCTQKRGRALLESNGALGSQVEQAPRTLVSGIAAKSLDIVATVALTGLSAAGRPDLA